MKIIRHYNLKNPRPMKALGKATVHMIDCYALFCYDNIYFQKWKTLAIDINLSIFEIGEHFPFLI